MMVHTHDPRALGGQRLVGVNFEASLGYIVKLSKIPGKQNKKPRPVRLCGGKGPCLPA